jgi:hypothetical protein
VPAGPQLQSPASEPLSAASPDSANGLSGKRDVCGALPLERRAQIVQPMEKPPAKRALAELAAPPPAVEPLPKRISAKVRRAVDLMVSGETKKICETAEKVGLVRESLSRALSVPHVAQYLRTQTARRLAIAAARAGAVKGELLDSANELVRDRASTFVLGLAGIAPASTPSINLNIEAKAGFVIDLSEDDRPMRIVSSTAAPTIDHEPDQARSGD